MLIVVDFSAHSARKIKELKLLTIWSQECSRPEHMNAGVLAIFFHARRILANSFTS
jgi:hypothetical protein